MIGSLATYRIVSDQNRIAGEWKWHACRPEPILGDTAELFTDYEKLIFCMEGSAMLDRGAVEHLLDRIGSMVQYDIEHTPF